MSPQKPEYFRPALIAGAVAGLLSGLPLISAGNCFCCLWIVGGAAVATRLLAGRTAGPLTSGDGAIVGALTGIVAAVVQAFVSLPFRSFDPEQLQKVVDWISTIGVEVPPSVLGEASEMSSRFMSPGWFLLFLFISAVVMCVFGVLGGVIGVSLFGRKAAPPAPPVVPPPPPAP
jgi:hypothetical protein